MCHSSFPPSPFTHSLHHGPRIQPPSTLVMPEVRFRTPHRTANSRTTPLCTEPTGAVRAPRQYSLFAVQIIVVFCEGVRTPVHQFRTDLPIGCWDSREMTFLESFRLTQNAFSTLCTLTMCTFGCCVIQKRFEHPISAHANGLSAAGRWLRTCAWRWDSRRCDFLQLAHICGLYKVQPG